MKVFRVFPPALNPGNDEEFILDGGIGAGHFANVGDPFDGPLDNIVPNRLPERVIAETSYTLMDEYKRLFDQVLRYAREIVLQPGEGYRRRVRWRSAHRAP